MQVERFGEESVLRLLTGFTNLLIIQKFKVSLGIFFEIIKQLPEEAIGNIYGEKKMIVSLTTTKLVSVRFHFVDKYLCSLII